MSGSVFYWFKSDLHNRRQYLTCNSTESKPLALRHGVPQGSVLGPTLFCAHYSNVTSAVKHWSCTLFAEDNEIHYSDGDIDNASNCVNGDLDNISSWLLINQMVVHPGKSEVMKIGTQRSLKNSNDLKIFIHNQSIFHICKKERTQKFMLSTGFLVSRLEVFCWRFINKRCYQSLITDALFGWNVQIQW